MKGAGKVNFDFCMFDMKSADEREGRQARKTKTRSIISNSPALLTELTKYQSHGRHQHITMQGMKGHNMPGVQRRVLQNRVRDHDGGEKNSQDNTSGVLDRLSLGTTAGKDITQTINELIKVDPHEKDVVCDHKRILR